MTVRVNPNGSLGKIDYCTTIPEGLYLIMSSSQPHPLNSQLQAGYHFPPELFQLLVDTIPRLCRSKRDVLFFFRGAGVRESMLRDLRQRLVEDASSINKFEMVRTLLARLNEAGDAALGERRALLQRVHDFEDFSTCWENDRLEAQGLVGQIRQVVNVKDSFTRMHQEREEEARKHREATRRESEAIRQKRETLDGIRRDLTQLFVMEDAHKRGILLEEVLNRFFQAEGILVRESFSRVGERGQGVVEQIDGVIEIDGEIYLVEMKWLKDRAGPGDVAQHLVRVFGRSSSRGIFISYSGYTDAAIATCKEALAKAVVVLCTLQELVLLTESESGLKDFLKEKVRGAVIDKEPLTRVPMNG